MIPVICTSFRSWKILPVFTSYLSSIRKNSTFRHSGLENANLNDEKIHHHRYYMGSLNNFHEKNNVLRHLKAKIEATGPMSVADYMKEALISPNLGYYMKQDVFGSKGDFITSPEISQIFGELIGVWFCNEWLKAGRPQPLQFVEFGPGRGTLADDVLRVFSKVLAAYNVSLSVHLIEVSPHMKNLQMTTLGIENVEKSESDKVSTAQNTAREYVTKHGYPLFFHSSIECVPELFSFFLAHEFFDALPIHKFERTEDGWREILVDCRGDELQFVLSRFPTPASNLLIDPHEKRNHVEISPESGVLIEKLCKRMEEDGGISLIIDYGHDGTKTDTFRSFKNHKLHDPLKSPGEADLTADVDFSYLRKCVKEEGYVVGPVTQEYFLKNMGIDIRLQKLLESASPEAQNSLKSGYDMLVNPNQMGERFKFFAIYPKVLDFILKKYPPAGFTSYSP